MIEDPVTIDSQDSIEQAAALMLQYKIGGLPVIDAQRHVVGMITETDLLLGLTRRMREDGKAVVTGHMSRRPSGAAVLEPVATVFEVAKLPAREVLPGVALRSVCLDSLMMTFVEYQQGSSVPAHSHDSEQITYVLDGFLEVRVGGRSQVIGAEQGIRIPPGVEHSSRPVGGPARALDAWSPPPADLG